MYLVRDSDHKLDPAGIQGGQCNTQLACVLKCIHLCIKVAGTFCSSVVWAAWV